MRPLPSTLSVAFHLTHNCNLRCAYCYSGEKFGAGMPDQTADLAVDFAVAEANRQSADHLEIIFFGGEPLLKFPLLCRIVDRLCNVPNGLRVSFKMSTNGLLLSEEVVRELARRNVFVSISLDGGPEVQDRQRPDALGRGTASRLKDGIPRLLSWNPCANVTCVCAPAFADRLDSSVQWIFAQGFSFVTTTLDYSAAWTLDDMERLRQAYERLAEWYVQQTLAGEKFYLSCFDERIRTWTKGPLERCERCSIGQRQFSVAPSGRLYPCVQFVREDRDDSLAIGDIHRGFDESRRAAVFRKSEAQKTECQGCALLPRCSNWCACVNWQTTGRLDRVSPVLCEHERILMPIADRAANQLWGRRNPEFLHKQYNPAFPVLSFVERLVIKEKSHA